MATPRFDCKLYVDTIAADLADATHRDYCRDITVPIYLYLKPRGDGSNEPILRRDEQAEDGLTLGECEALPRHYSRDQLYAWLADRLRRLPIIPAAA